MNNYNGAKNENDINTNNNITIDENPKDALVNLYEKKKIENNINNINENININQIINEKNNASLLVQNQSLPELKQIINNSQILNKSHSNFFGNEDIHVGEK